MIIEVRNLKKRFSGQKIAAVGGVSFGLQKNTTLGIVGETGSGKSTLAKLILRLIDPDEGEIGFEGRRIDRAGGGELRRFREKVQAVFQDPFLSLDPRMTISDSLKEIFLLRGKKTSLDSKVENLLKTVDLPGHFASKYPHQLSGGECQRIAIARAISAEPDLIICDEPVSSLDCLVRAQILNLLLKLQRERSMSYLFISHDLSVVRHMADEVMVMKDGLICEKGPAKDLFLSPKHPYTRNLIQSFEYPCQALGRDL